MAFSKQEMQDELLEFLKGYATSVNALFGNYKKKDHIGNIEDALSSDVCIKNSNLWSLMNDLYDFGVKGILVPVLGTELNISGHTDAEIFFNCIATGTMYPFLEDWDVIYPKKCIHTVRIAAARLVLEGGERDMDWGADEDGNNNFDRLTLSEVALLAGMDERSVRNAANPKANNPLNTVSEGKRSFVTASEAKRWLADRKGYIPTQIADQDKEQVNNKEVSLPEDLVNLMTLKAEQSGLTLADFIKTVL